MRSEDAICSIARRVHIVCKNMGLRATISVILTKSMEHVQPERSLIHLFSGSMKCTKHFITQTNTSIKLSFKLVYSQTTKTPVCVFNFFFIIIFCSLMHIFNELQTHPEEEH